ncbi:MAG: ATP-dependent metallopeptidase FtsH/Yme1/Tma family protein, partial [Sulfurimonas sp.]
MPSSKTNRIVLIVSAFLVIVLILFALLRDTADAITLREAQKLLDQHAVTKVIATKEYVYLKTKENNLYKIASSQVTPGMFAEYKVEIGSKNNLLIYLLVFIVFLGLGSLLFKFFQKRGFLSDVSFKKLSSDSADVTSTNPLDLS